MNTQDINNIIKELTSINTTMRNAQIHVEEKIEKIEEQFSVGLLDASNRLSVARIAFFKEAKAFLESLAASECEGSCPNEGSPEA